MNYFVCLAVLVYLGWLVYQFPLFELHREANKRNIEVSPPINSRECFSMFWRQVVKTSIHVLGAVLGMFICFAPPYYMHTMEIIPMPTGWWILLYVLIFMGWMIITTGIIVGLFAVLDSKLKGFNIPLDDVKKQLNDIKTQPLPFFETRATTPPLVRQLQKLSGLNRYKTLSERFPDGIIRPSKPSPLRYVLYALLIGFVVFPIVVSVINDDWRKLHLYWVTPICLIGLLLFFYLGGFLFSVLGNIILKPLNLFYEHSKRTTPYLIYTLNNLFRINANDEVLPFLGILFWVTVSFWFELELLNGIWETLISWVQ